MFAVCSAVSLFSAYIKTLTEATHNAGLQGQECVANNYFEVLGLRCDLFMRGS